eukprot:5889112-Amphidinium_carterae.4
MCAEAGALQGAFNLCTYYHPGWKTVFMHHGDEFIIRVQEVKQRRKWSLLASEDVSLENFKCNRMTQAYAMEKLPPPYKGSMETEKRVKKSHRALAIT